MIPADQAEHVKQLAASLPPLTEAEAERAARILAASHPPARSSPGDLAA